MASRIKGITIEINGDTTKLSQALRETDTQLTTVQKNLRDVERLLKLDPTNTELLAQKQRLLAEQSALAADRLAQMEDAANHLDSSLSQSQLDDFNLELDLTRARASLAEQELRDFEQRLNDVDDSAEDSSDSLNDVGDAADGMDDGFSLADGVISNFVGGAMTKLLDIALQAAEAIWNLDEATEEYRESMALLNTAFETAGFTSDTARQAYEGFYTILGDTGQATEASQLLSQLATSTQDVAEWIDIAAGVYGTFGESIPIESLIEAANETAKTGQVTGTLADALNWVGLSEDQVNAQLAELNDETLRARLLMDLLSNTYKTASDSFYENSDAILESRQAQLEMDDTLATLGQSVADLKTQLLETLSVVFEALGPIIQAIAENIGAKLGPVLEFIGIVAEALKEPLEALGNVAESIINAFSNSMRTAEPIMKLFATAIGIVSGAVSTLLNLLAELINLLADAQAWFLDLLGLGGKGGDIEVTTSGSGSRTMADASTYSIPAFASGGVIPPNNPFLAVLGDNRQEPEVVAPYSTIKQAARDAMAERGGTGQITIVLRAADGSGVRPARRAPGQHKGGMSVQVIMDGVSYRLNVRYETLGRSFRLEEGQNAGTMLSGDYTRDLMGTYYDYSMEVEPDPRFPADYDAFYEAISAPVSSHSLTLPYGQSTITFDAMVSEGTDLYRGKVANRTRWGGLQVQFTAKKPQRTPT